MASFSCSDAQLASVTAIAGDSAASTICETYNVTDMGATNAVLAYTLSQTQEVQSGVNASFLLTSAYLVFLMQAGFAMLCAGCVRSKNTLNILLKNVIDACVSGVFFYLIGYGFAFGAKGDTNEFIGNWDFALESTQSAAPVPGWYTFMFQWAFSAAAATIVSGAVAERTLFTAYLSYSALISAFVYPVVVHWMWSADGFLSGFKTSGKLLGIGAIDFAGSGVVHMVGGMAALMGAYFVGPRIGRFDTAGKPSPMPGHNSTLVVLGTFLLWFGWYGFNPGSQLSVASYASATIVSRVAVTTTLAAAAGGLATMVLVRFTDGVFNLNAVCNGILGGLVAITSGCSVLSPWAALIVGFLAAPVFCFSEKFILNVLKVDDPVSAVALHLCCGILGVLFPGFLAKHEFVVETYGDKAKGYKGVLYGGNGKVLACQITEVVCIMAWVGGAMGLFFFAYKKLGMLRVTAEDEMSGLDISKHGGSAYHHHDDDTKAVQDKA